MSLIVIIDDDESLKRFVRDTLEAYGHSVEELSTAHKAC